MIKLGMPVTKINGRWYGHYRVIDEWLQRITDPRKTKKREFNISIKDGFCFEDESE